MKNVLFYYPSNKRSNVLETLLEELRKKGYQIIVLTTCEKGEFHEAVESFGIRTYSHDIKKGNSGVYYFKQIAFLIKFCKQNNIDLVLSHLQHANIISVFAQYFTKAKFIIFRHQFRFNVFSNDETELANPTEVVFDKVINRLSKVLIVPSLGVYNAILKYERINRSKMRIIPYMYDFKKYNKPDAEKVEELQKKYESRLLLLMCSRLVKFKRHYIVLPIIKKLIAEGLDIKLMILDEGPEEDSIKKYITDNWLSEHVFLLGYRNDFINFMAASDILIHPSLSEASNSTVKEMGLLKKPVAVCSMIGDFDEYIVNGRNGFLLSPNNTEVELEKLLREIYNNKNVLRSLGENLHDTVITKFNRSNEILEKYLSLIEENVS